MLEAKFDSATLHFNKHRVSRPWNPRANGRFDGSAKWRVLLSSRAGFQDISRKTITTTSGTGATTE